MNTTRSVKLTFRNRQNEPILCLLSAHLFANGKYAPIVHENLLSNIQLMAARTINDKLIKSFLNSLRLITPQKISKRRKAWR